MKKLNLLFLSLFIIGLIGTTASVAATIYSTGTNPGTVSNAGTATGGGAWSATTTWAGGVVPLSTDDAVIVSGDLVNITASANIVNLTVQTGGMVRQGASISNSTVGTGSFTMQSGSWWYAAYSSATKLPQGFGTYSIDPNSNWVITTAASSSICNLPPALYGNLYVYKTGAVLAAINTITYYNIQGNLTVSASASSLKMTNNKSAQVDTIHIGGNVNIILGVLSGMDVSKDWTADPDFSTPGQRAIINIDGNVNVGDASTALGAAGLACHGSDGLGWQRTVFFNITGNLTYINGAKFEAGTNNTTPNSLDSAVINLQGNLSTDATVVIATNTSGIFQVNFVGNSTKTMTLGERLKFSPKTIFTLSINKSAGDVTINNSADTIDGTLNLTSGNLVLAGNALLVTTISGGSATSHIVFDAAGNGSVALDVPASTNALLLPVGTAAYYTPLTLQYPVAPTAGVITLSKVTPGMDGFNIGSLSDAGYTLLRKSAQYWLYSNTASGSSYTLSIDGSSSQTGIDDPSNLRVIHSADGSTFDLIGTHSAGSGSTAVRTAIPDGTSGRFYLGGRDPGNNPLPVELSSFTSSVNGRDIQLNWITKTEVNSNKFVIERALVNTKDAAIIWASIGTIQASGTSNSSNKYSYTEKNLQAAKYQYRLKMIDNDGSYKYSNVVETEIALPKNFELSQNYPNPFNPSTKIDYQVPVDAKVILEVYNIAGQKVIELVNQDQSAGYYTVDFGSSKISSGVYIYRIVASDKATGNNFSSIKKMMLLK
jgi:hypothetical protein